MEIISLIFYITFYLFLPPLHTITFFYLFIIIVSYLSGCLSISNTPPYSSNITVLCPVPGSWSSIQGISSFSHNKIDCQSPTNRPLPYALGAVLYGINPTIVQPPPPPPVRVRGQPKAGLISQTNKKQYIF